MPEILFPAADEFSLVADRVHLHAASLENAEQQAATCIHLLSNDEREKASRYRFNIDRARYIVGRGTLRILLGRYLQIPPEQLQFKYGLHGKPALDHPQESSQLHFNLTHSHDLAVYAFSLNRNTGIDIEAVRPLPDLFDVAALHFSKAEIASLKSLPESKQPQAFFNCWTRKEAYLKAHGGGINDHLREITVSLLPEEPAQLIEVAYDPEEASKWELAAFTPATGYIGAVAVEHTSMPWTLHKSQVTEYD